MRIEEETEVVFDQYEDLTYSDIGWDDVELYVKGDYLGNIKVWLDTQMDGREYICVNYEILYLDKLKNQ